MPSKPSKQTFRTPGKRRKRQYGEGALYQRADGMWVGTAPLPPGPDGKRRRTPPVYSMDKNEAKEKLDKLKEDLKNGVEPIPKQKIRVDDRMRRWAERKSKNWSPNHYRNVLSTIKQQVEPSIGHADFKTLDTEHIHWMLSWMDAQTKVKKTKEDDGTVTETEVPRWESRTKQIAYDRVRDWLDDELKERPKLIRENVAALVERPPAISKERGTHTDEQARKVLETALEREDPLVTLWTARYVSGLRQAELLGMQEDRINFEDLTWDISWTLQQLPLKPGMKNSDDPNRFEINNDAYEHIPVHGNMALVRPKTKKPRIQPLPAEFAFMLRTYLDNRKPNQWGLVWTTATGKPIRREYENEAWRNAQELADVPIITGHGTRHTANTLIPMDEAHRQKFLGQSTARANRIYLHADLEKLREGQNALAGMLLPEKLVPKEQRTTD
ncbi:MULTISPECIES: tyrosine-type recombinase/integrase [Actinomycetes]|uniref:tyrosine-type recombinase/integrase n=1 Tax=Micromonospora sp. NPDC005367 TaxID=3155590 RepID=UPI0033A38B42